MAWIKNFVKSIYIKIMIKYENENYTNGKFDSKKSWYYSRLEHKRRNAIGLIALLFAVILAIIDGLLINKSWLHSHIVDLEYKNNHKYKNVRELVYIGGQKLFDSDNSNSIRWYPLYLDINTNEILRGGNIENYITAGGCKVGLDKIDILEDRNTRLGFQQYILKWTGAIKYKEYSIDLPDESFGISRATQDFNKPIDIVADINWNRNKEYSSNDKYLISTISDVKNYSINDTVLEASGKFTENEYIFNILRNCFGYISDDFYNLVMGKNKFSEIYIHEVEIGDIGVYWDKNKQICVGICAGFDKNNNPIFTVCTSSNKIKNKTLNKYTKYNRNQSGNNSKEEYGFNLLVTEKKHVLPLLEKHIFEKYYHTNLPFKDKKGILDYNIAKFRINNISEYNKQVYYKEYTKKNMWDGNDLSYRLYKERLNRINKRELKAVVSRNEYKIDLTVYNNKNVSILNDIYNVKTGEYIEDKSYYSEYEREQFKLIDEQREKMREEEHKKGIEKFKEKIMNRKDELKGKTFEEARKIFETKNSFLSEEGEEILKECLIEINQ